MPAGRARKDQSGNSGPYWCTKAREALGMLVSLSLGMTLHRGERSGGDDRSNAFAPFQLVRQLNITPLHTMELANTAQD